MRQLARVLATLYDIVIVLPLMVERLLRERRPSNPSPSPQVEPGFEAAERAS
jgi:hypothetical protein